MNYTQYNSNKNPHRTIAAKDAEREKIVNDVAEFLANGGKIKTCDKALDVPHNRAQAHTPII